MIQHILLRWLEHIGSHQHQSIAANRLRMLAELNRRSCTVIARPSVDRHTARSFIYDCFKSFHSLCSRKGNRFPRAAKRRQAMHACLQQKAHKCPRALRAEAFIVVEGRDGWGKHSTQFRLFYRISTHDFLGTKLFVHVSREDQRTVLLCFISKFSGKANATYTAMDGNFNPQSPSPQYPLHPLSSSATLCYPKPTINFRSKTAFVWCSQRFDTRNNNTRLRAPFNQETEAGGRARECPATVSARPR